MTQNIIKRLSQMTEKEKPLTDLHMHTKFCDGKSTPEEMVISAIEKHLDIMGFSGHSYTFFDESYCMSKEGVEEYKAQIRALQSKYSGKIKILLGIEQDLYSLESTKEFDYTIGSVHYFKFNENYVPVDESALILKNAADKYFGGDMLSLCEKYFEQVIELKNMRPDIIGHIDLITKFNENGELFDVNNPRYIAAWRKAVDELLKLNVPFEYNTGAISRGVRATPYPHKSIRDYILANGGKLIRNSDAHHRDYICFKFYEEY